MYIIHTVYIYTVLINSNCMQAEFHFDFQLNQRQRTFQLCMHGQIAVSVCRHAVEKNVHTLQ